MCLRLYGVGMSAERTSVHIWLFAL
jgi:hypothetical protein